MVFTLSPRILPSFDIAISASVTWSRPWASVWKDSRRSAVQRTGRLIWRVTQVQTVSSL